MPHSGCPGMAMQTFPKQVSARRDVEQADDDTATSLTNWPIQLHLVPPHAPFLKNADLLLAADCVPSAMPDFHRRYLKGRPLLIGCPKLDDVQAYVEKLAAILQVAKPRSLTIAHMQVPCCMGLMRIAAEAKSLAQSDIPIHETVVSLQGEILKTT
jgi:hypothetical protein